MPDPVWFWQRIVSPHMAGLAAALAAGGRQVTYVAEQEMSADRVAQGWQAPELGEACLRFAPSSGGALNAARAAPAESIHICQSFRSNGPIGVAQRALAARGLKQWVIMETVYDSGWQGTFKRMEYRRLVQARCAHLQGVLAIGHATPQWLVERGMSAENVFPFAYFLADRPLTTQHFDPDGLFRFLYVGQLIERKRIDLLVDALQGLTGVAFELAVVGSGPLEDALRALADRKLAGRVRWLGGRPIGEIPSLMAKADCLVLPSRHDGWGAVVSEALMNGTPAVCSDACGAAGVVRASGVDGVFPAGDMTALTAILEQIVANGRQTPERRAALAGWGRCLGAAAGAEYLDKILSHMADTIPPVRPVPPWEGTKGSPNV